MKGYNEIYVYESWKSDVSMLIGTIYVEENRGKEMVSFEYDAEWLKELNNNTKLDSDINMYRGRQYVPNNKAMFGMMEDSCPDRWGRLLIKRREAILARREDRKPVNLTESDYLIGVYDETRMGALRYSIEKGGEFLSNDKELAAPPWTTLRTLENASLELEKAQVKDEDKWLKQLVAPGSSLGGARPKASITAPDGTLWIAKFPSRNDEVDVGAWEMVVHDIAKKCGISVPEAKLERYSKLGSTFLTKRFDRDGNRRIHFASAMTLLGKTDGANASDGSSYEDIASFIKTNSASPQKDLHELWSRIVLNMAVSNTDDHMRNHGFILDKNGWMLSPMYDVNPNIYGDMLSLNVDSNSNLIDFNLALAVSKLYGYTDIQAKERLEEITEIVESNWKKLAKEYGVPRSEIEMMAPAFFKKEVSPR